MENKMTPLSPNDTFHFSCGRQRPCFNACCRDLNQFLTPYDILKLKNKLNLSSASFLARYTTRHTGPASGLPVVTLKPATSARRNCPFMDTAGCRVYSDRPSSCRMYPLIRTVSRCRKTGSTSAHFILLKEPHCGGFDHAESQTVHAWMASQHLAVYNQMNDMLMDIITIKNQYRPGPLDYTARQIFYTALYDLDTLRSNIAAGRLPAGLDLDPATLEIAVNDEMALLRLGHSWIKHLLLKKNRGHTSRLTGRTGIESDNRQL